MAEYCDSGVICRITDFDIKTAANGLSVLELEPSARYFTIQIRRLLMGSVPMAALLVNASAVTAALVFKTFRETTLVLPSALTLQELVLQEAASLRELTAQRNSHLQRLEINNCAMSIVPPSVRNLLQLKEFTVRRCAIKTFNLALLAHLRQLETVLFVGNRITTIHPPTAPIVQSIRLLDLSHNQLPHLDMASLVSLKQLHALSMANNQLGAIRYVRDTVVAFPRLTTLDLSNNKLQRVAFDQLSAPSLEHLQLSFNELSDVPGPLAKFPKLATFLLNSNALESFSFALFAGLRDLTNLEVCQNRLHTLDVSSPLQLPRLNMLKMSDNQLQSVNLEQLTMPRLSFLDLNHNLLTIVPNVFESDIKQLQLVSVIGNPLSCATLERYRSYVQRDVLVPKWMLSDAELCSTGKMFVLNEKRRSCCSA